MDSRTTRRHDVVLDVVLEGKDGRLDCRTRNVSLGGLFVTLAEQLPLGTKVTLTFSIPGLAEPIVAPVVVRWHEPGGFGCQFDGLRAREIWALGRWLDELRAAR